MCLSLFVYDSWTILVVMPFIASSKKMCIDIYVMPDKFIAQVTELIAVIVSYFLLSHACSS